MPTTVYQEAINLVAKAVKEHEKKNYEGALRLYNLAIEHFHHAINYEIVGESAKERVRTECSQYLQVSKILKEEMSMKPVENSNGESKITKTTNKGIDSEFAKQVEGSIVVETPNIKWSDVAGLDAVKETLKEAVILPIQFPHLFTGKRKPLNGILLFGPPGTGKSFLAKALATEANNSTFFSVSSSRLLSKWFGESEKLIKNMFDLARQQKPSVIFIDEVDCMCSSRSDGELDCVRRVKTEFLVQMQGVDNENDGILILGATNIPWCLDPAFRRRFEKRIYIPLPDEKARLAIFKSNIGTTPNSLTEDDFKILAEGTDGFSGADISVLVRDALMTPIRKLQKATHFKRVRGPLCSNPNIIVNDLLASCSPDFPGAIKISLKQIPANRLLEPDVTMEDMLLCLANAKPSVNKADLFRLQKFADDFGQEG